MDVRFCNDLNENYVGLDFSIKGQNYNYFCVYILKRVTVKTVFDQAITG